MKILLIDDDVFLRDMYATKFAECGHEVEAVDKAELGLQLLKQGQAFDVILVDMVMPGMTGIDFLKTVHEEGIVDKAITIVLSNQGQQADINEALEAGAVSYIVKAEHIPSEVVEKTEEIWKEHKKK